MEMVLLTRVFYRLSDVQDYERRNVDSLSAWLLGSDRPLPENGSAASVATGAPPEVAGFQGGTAGRPAVFLASLKASSKLQMAFHPQGLVVA